MRIVRSTNRQAVASLLEVTKVRDRATETRAAEIVARVRRGGDAALKRYARELDGLTGRLEIPKSQWGARAESLPRATRLAIATAARHIRRVARQQVPKGWRLTVAPGISVEQKVV